MPGKAAKHVTAREAIRALPSRGRLLFPTSCGTTLSLLEAAAEERGRFEALHLYTGIMFADPPILRHTGQNITLTTWHVMPPTQKLVDEGRADYLPLRLSQVPHTFGQRGEIPIDALFIQVSPPDARGYVSLGAEVGPCIDLVPQTRLVIAEVNRQAPRTLGASLAHVSDIDYLVEADYPLIEYTQAATGDLEKKIAGYVADLIPSGATLQMGIGAIPEALIHFLGEKRDLGIHSGIITDAFIPLIERGVINNSRKTIDQGKTVAGELFGSPALFRYAHENQRVHLASVAYVQNPMVVRQLENFVSVNSAVEIDLTGQVNGESVDGRQISGLGGQFDFIEGVLHSPNGVSIFALPSTAVRGKVSRIAAKLGEGAVVSTPRYCTDYVVTEYGVARLKGKTIRQRAEALIAIAHPDFRDALSASLSRVKAT
jgi:4-hydroxybutyrate CoA-transferase